MWASFTLKINHYILIAVSSLLVLSLISVGILYLRNKSLNTEITALTAQNTQLLQLNSQLKKTAAVNDELITDLNSGLSQAKEALELYSTQLCKLQEATQDDKDSQASQSYLNTPIPLPVGKLLRTVPSSAR